jgi:hypothetical protein
MKDLGLVHRLAKLEELILHELSDVEAEGVPDEPGQMPIVPQLELQAGSEKGA